VTRCLVGTRSLLGEGWDAPELNVLVDLTAAATMVTVHQTRGRTIRLDAEWPRKVANNWDVVCLAPSHPRGLGDYARFVRKHANYHSLAEDGAVETSVSHVHPRLSPFGPPAADTLPSINQDMLTRAADRETIYARWGIGQPYVNGELSALTVRWDRHPGIPRQPSLQAAVDHAATAARPLWSRLPGWLLPLVGVIALVQLLTGRWSLLPILLVGALLLAGAVAVGWWQGRNARVEPSGTLEALAGAVADGLGAIGALRPQLGAAAVRVSARSDGYYRCFLHGALLEESQRFSAALEEVLAPLDRPRYLIARPIYTPPGSQLDRVLLRLGLWYLRPSREVYHAVPRELGANRKHAERFAAAWRRHVGPGRLLPATDPKAQAILELNRGVDLFGVSAQLRTVWE
jgi:hypothetical protein